MTFLGHFREMQTKPQHHLVFVSFWHLTKKKCKTQKQHCFFVQKVLTTNFEQIISNFPKKLCVYTEKALVQN